jgi:alpha-tubulin suppressor-like RCC1 family protein
MTNAIAIAAGNNHTCALLNTGSVQCWGLNDSGRLGNNTTTNSSVPVTASGMTGAIAVDAGYSHNCAPRSNGTVRCLIPIIARIWPQAPQRARHRVSLEWIVEDRHFDDDV